MATLQDIYNELKNNLLSVRKDVAVNPGSVVSDVFLTPTSYILYRNRVLLDYVQALQSLYTIKLLLNSPDALSIIASVELKTVEEVQTDISNFIDKIGDNYMLTRLPSINAQGSVFFGRIDPPSQSITVPAGTIVKTADGKQYTVDNTETMNVGDPNLYDASSNLYVIEVAVTAVDGGTAGNTVIGSITQFVNQVSGLNYVFNKSNFVNGIDVETNDQFIVRIKTKLSGNNFGTINGYKNLILTNFRTVKDVLVVPAGNLVLKLDGSPLMERDGGMGGVVDIWVLDETPPVEVPEYGVAFNMSVGGLNGYIFPNQPIAQVLVYPNTGLPHYDTTSLAHSYAETTYMYFSPPGSGGPVSPFDITSSYYKIVTDIQTFLNQPQNAILGNTIKKSSAIENIALVKKAIEMPVSVSASIVLKSSADETTTIASCEQAILTYMSQSLLGVPIAQSDIVGVLETVSGVDYVKLPLDIFQFASVGIPAQVNDLLVEPNEYIRAGAITVTV